MSELVRDVVTPSLINDAAETIDAIHHGHVDAVVIIKGAEGPQVVLLEGADESYRVLVERMSEGALTVGPDGSILYCNGRVSELTGYPAEFLVGRNIATLFEGEAPELAPDVSLETNVLRNGQKPLPVKIWARPISISDTTATLVTLTDLSIYRRAEEIAAAERFARSVLEQATNAILVLGPDGHITHASSVAENLAERPPIGRAFSEAFPLARSAADAGILGRVSEESLDQMLVTKPFHGVEVRLRSERFSKRAYLLSAGPLYNERKSSVGSIVTLTEITERKRAEEQHAMIAAELNHRVKNILTVVQSLAAQTVRSSKSLENFNSAFSGRLKALATAHDVLMQTHWTGIDLSELLTTVLAPYRSPGEERIRTSGPQILLPVDAVVPLSMAFHELTTNALKYGSLSVSDGHVDVGWQLIDIEDNLVELIWQESGGPMVERGRTAGFGTTLIDRVLTYDLDAKTEIDFDPEGLRCKVRFRVLGGPSCLHEERGPPPAHAATPLEDSRSRQFQLKK
ncbi:MAG: HWE histidine kinase domain-containing protein [Pseudolabrys sp.]